MPREGAIKKHISLLSKHRTGENTFKNRLSGFNLLVICFFTAYLISGLIIFKDYGISWDEYRNRETGLVSLNYIQDYTGLNVFKINEELPKLNSFVDKDYGVFFELILVIAEKLLSLNDTRDIFLLRHLLTFLFFWLSCIAFYKIAQIISDSKKTALLTTAMLIISPRIFADSFYNSKDIILLAGFNFAIYSMLLFLRKPLFRTLMFHSFICAVLINIRIAGIMLPFITMFLLIIPSGITGIKQKINKKVLYIAGLLTTISLFTIILWPYLWEAPFDRFVSVFSTMKSFNRWSDEILYRGSFFLPAPPPWHYIPTWIGITTPAVYLLLFIMALIITVIAYFKKPLEILNIHKSNYIFILFSWILIPVLTALIFKSTLYDGWRQLYFIYPAIILTCIISIKKIKNFINKYFSKTYNSTVKIIVFSPLILTLIILLVKMAQNHPNQQVFFNILAGDNAGKSYELDYWGVSYRQALEELLKADTSQKIKLLVHDSPGFFNSLILKESERKRIEYCSDSTAEYFMSNYRFRENYNNSLLKEYPFNNEFITISAWGNKISGVYRLK